MAQMIEVQEDGSYEVISEGPITSPNFTYMMATMAAVSFATLSGLKEPMTFEHSVCWDLEGNAYKWNLSGQRTPIEFERPSPDTIFTVKLDRSPEFRIII